MRARRINIDLPTIRKILVNEFDIEEGTPDRTMLEIWNNSFWQFAQSRGLIDLYMKQNDGEEAPMSMSGFVDEETEFEKWVAKSIGLE